MKKIIYILIISLLVTNLSKAQVSGYMGKKFIFMYDIHTRPSFSMPNVNGKDGLTSFNLKHTFGLEFVTGEHSSIGVSFSLFKTMFNFDDLDYGYGYSTTGSDMIPKPNGVGSMSVKGYSFYYKRFIKGNIAPLGSYLKFSLDYYSWDNNYMWSQNNYTNFPDVMTKISTTPDNSSNSTFGLSLNVGNQRIYFDHLVLNSSVQVGILFAGGGGIFNTVKPGFNSYGNYNDAVKYASASRLFSYNLWSINIGIGYLLF